jgi:hypothetical protein
VAGTLSLSGSHHHQRNLRYLPLRPPSPPIALGLAERLFSSSSSSKRSTKRSAAKKATPMDSAGGEPFYVVRKGDVIGIYKNLADCQAQVSNSVNIFFASFYYHVIYLSACGTLSIQPISMMIMCIQRIPQ